MQDTWHSELFPLEIFELGFDKHQVQGVTISLLSMF